MQKKRLPILLLIDQLPNSPQWNYTFGAGYRHLAENGNWLFTISRNTLDNRATKYYRNIETPENLLYDYQSQETENKIENRQKPQHKRCAGEFRDKS